MSATLAIEAAKRKVIQGESCLRGRRVNRIMLDRLPIVPRITNVMPTVERSLDWVSLISNDANDILILTMSF